MPASPAHHRIHPLPLHGPAASPPPLLPPTTKHCKSEHIALPLTRIMCVQVSAWAFEKLADKKWGVVGMQVRGQAKGY